MLSSKLLKSSLTPISLSQDCFDKIECEHIMDWSKSIGGGGGATGNVADKKHMTHPLLLAQNYLTHP